jgi:hypothetical protein
MKRFAPLLISLVIVLASAFAAPMPAQADGELPGELEYIDADLSIFIPQLEDYQDAYYITNDKYFQSLVSHNTPPSGATAPDNLSSHPDDQDETLADLWEYADLPSTIAWSFRVDTYSGPEGDGYVLIVEATVDDAVWHKEINFGPETYRNLEWFEVEM